MPLSLAVTITALKDIPLPMHAPDGFFTLPVAVFGYLISGAFVAFAIQRTSRQLNERTIPMMGVMAAFIFAAQMLNFPVAGGTSGHMIGGALAAIILGPWAAILVMTSVIGLQALLFQDGGLVVLGVNVLNMGIISCLLGYLVFQLARRVGKSFSYLLAAGFAAAWISVVIASIAAAAELAISGTSPFSVAFPAMAGVHTLIGIGEGLITIGALSFIRASRPDLLPVRAEVQYSLLGRPLLQLRWWIVGYFVALVVAFMSPLASGAPDGLERVAEDKGFLSLAEDAPYGVIAHYALPGVGNEALATILAGIIGVTIVYLLVAGTAYITYRAISNRRTHSA